MHLVQGAFNRDYTVVMGVVIFYAIFLLLLNLLVDIAYTWIDPRVELA
jgi:oligopeptide transport system permease protein